MNKKIPEVTLYEHIKRYANQKVTVKGRYTELNVSQKQTQIKYIGRVKITLKDNHFVILETDKQGIRSKEEIEKYRGKPVLVIGTLYPNMYAWGDGSQATIVGPCLTGIEFL